MDNNILKELAEIKSLILSNKRVLSTDEAAVFLGMSKSKLYKLTASREIPHSKPTNGLLFFDKEEITQWALGSKVVDPKEEARKYISNNCKR